MNAFEIAWNRDGSLVACGLPNGRVEVFQTMSYGGPGEPAAEILYHRAEVVRVGFVEDDRVVAVDEEGKWSVHRADGELVFAGVTGLERCSGAIDLASELLFVFGFRDIDPVVLVVELVSGDVHEYPLPPSHWVEMGARIEVLEPGVVCALYRDEAWDDESESATFSEGLLTMSRGGRFDAIPFSRSSQSYLFGDHALTRIATASEIGRFARVSVSGPPLEEGEGAPLAALRLDVFDGHSPSLSVRIASVEVEAKQAKVLLAAEEGTEAFDDVVRDLMNTVKNIALTPDGRFVWVVFWGGVVRRVELSSGDASPLIRPGVLPGRDHPSIDEIFNRTPTNSPTLALSPDGRFVAFSNPNQFFSVDELELNSKETFVTIPRAPEALLEAPKSVVPIHGDPDQVLVQAHGGQFWRVDVEEMRIVDEFEIPYGDCESATLSPDGLHLVMAMSGANPALLVLRDDEVWDLPIPPHTLLARYFEPGRVVMVHHDGAVLDVRVDEGELNAARFREGAEVETAEGIEFTELLAAVSAEKVWGIPEEMLDQEPEVDLDALAIFEQSTPVHGVDFAHVGGVCYVTLVKEMGLVERFEVHPGGEIVARGPWQGASGIWKSVAGNRDHAACINRETGVMVVVDLASDSTYELEVGQHTRVVAMAEVEGPKVWLFGDRTGELKRFDAVRQVGETVFSYVGGAVEDVCFDASGGRLLVREVDGPLQVFEWRTGRRVGDIRLVVDASGRRLEFE